jgi:hypothetical protein
MGQFEDEAKRISQLIVSELELIDAALIRIKNDTNDINALGAAADQALEDCTEAPPVDTQAWLPTALPLPEIPGAQAPAIVGWHDVVPATANGVSIFELKANQVISVHQAGVPTIIERHFKDRWLIDDTFAGWTILDGSAAYGSRSTTTDAVRLEFAHPTTLCLIVEGGDDLTHDDLISPGIRATPAGVGTAQVRRGTSDRIYPTLLWDITEAGWIGIAGLKDTGALFYGIAVQEGRNPIQRQFASSIQHSEKGQKVNFAGKTWNGWHRMIDDRTGQPNDHEHGQLSRLDLLPWNLSDPSADKSGFKGIEFGASTIHSFEAPERYGMVVPQILMHLQTSQRARIENARHTFDHAVWGVPVDATGPQDWEPLAMLPFRAVIGTPVAVYGGNIERPLVGEMIEVLPGGERDITVAGTTSPATANPGYETHRPSIGMADGIPVEGPIVVATDDPCTRLAEKTTINGDYQYNVLEDLHYVPVTPNNGRGERRWVIFPAWDVGRRYVISGRFMVQRFGLERDPETGLLHWFNTQDGIFATPHSSGSACRHERRGR